MDYGEQDSPRHSRAFHAEYPRAGPVPRGGGDVDASLSATNCGRPDRPCVASVPARGHSLLGPVKTRRCSSTAGGRPVHPDLIEMGIDILNPQVTAGMTLPASIAWEHCFWGGGVIRRVLASCSPAEVRAEVRGDAPLPWGGFVFTRTYMANFPAENVARPTTRRRFTVEGAGGCRRADPVAVLHWAA
jgi:hypothetical protein